MEKYKDLEIQDLLKSELKEEQNIKKEKEKSKNIDSKKHKKEENKLQQKSDNFKFEEIEKEDAYNQVLYISTNQENNYIALGTLSGFKIFSLLKKKIEFIYQFQYDPIEPVKIIEMISTSQLVLLVGKDETTHLSQKKLSLFDLGQKKIIYSLNPYNTEIKLVRLNKKRIIVYADKTIFIYDISNMKLLHSIKLDEDIINTEKTFYQGQICLSQNSNENNY